MFNIFNMFKKEKDLTKDDTKENHLMDKILVCAKGIIEDGDIVEDNTASRTVPHIVLRDSKNNTLRISWYSSNEVTSDLFINGKEVPNTYDSIIFNLVQERVQVLRKKHLESVIDSVK